MAITPRLALLVLAAGILVTGCGEPTGYRKEVRTNAKARVNAASAQLSYDQARQAFEVGSFDQARRDVEVAIARMPEVPEYHTLQGRIFLESHRLEPAARSFEAAIERDAEYAPAHYYLAIVNQRWSDDEAALVEYRAAFTHDATNVQYLLACAETLVTLDRLDEAESIIAEQLTYFEHNAALHHLLGQIALLQGRATEAVERLREARMLDPDNLDLLEEVARAQYSAGQYAACHDSIMRLNTLLPATRDDLRFLEARCLALLGRSVEARTLYLALTNTLAGDPALWSELGMLSWDLGDYRRVAQCGARLVNLAPERYEGYLLQGLNEQNKGNAAAATRLFNKAVERAPDSALPNIILGQSFEGLGNLHAARAAYADAVAVEPDNLAARELLDRANRMVATGIEE